jgi:hypothetical protein
MLATNTVRGFLLTAGIPLLLAFSRQHPEAVERTVTLATFCISEADIRK